MQKKLLLLHLLLKRLSQLLKLLHLPLKRLPQLPKLLHLPLKRLLQLPKLLHLPLKRLPQLLMLLQSKEGLNIAGRRYPLLPLFFCMDSSRSRYVPAV